MLSNFAPCLFYLGGSLSVLSTQGASAWSLLQLFKLACGSLSLCLLSLGVLHKLRSFLPPKLRPNETKLMKRLVTLELCNYAVLNLAALYEFHALSSVNCWSPTAFGCSQTYALSFHTAIMPKLVISQLTGRFWAFPELIRALGFVTVFAWLAAGDGSLTATRLAVLLLEAVAVFFCASASCAPPAAWCWLSPPLHAFDACAHLTRPPLHPQTPS